MAQQEHSITTSLNLKKKCFKKINNCFSSEKKVLKLLVNINKRMKIMNFSLVIFSFFYTLQHVRSSYGGM